MTIPTASSLLNLPIFDPSTFDPATFDPTSWLTNTGVGLWRWLAARWPSLLAAAVLLVLLRSAGGLVHRAAWRRTVSGGRWLAVVPPRSLDPTRYEAVARKLYDIAHLANAGRWRLLHLPIAWEIHATGGQLRHGLWVPPRVSPVTAADDLRRAWPGAVVTATDPPPVAGRRRVAYRLAPYAGHPDTGWLVDDPGPRSRSRRGGEPDVDLGGVLTALIDADGVALLQVLIRPASPRQRARLAAARQPGTVRGTRAGLLLGAVTYVLRVLIDLIDVFLSPGRSSSQSSAPGREPATAVQREEAAEARAKYQAHPHVSVSVRAYAADGTRRQARRAARSVLAGYSDTSRWLIPVRLFWMASAVLHRWARREHWLLMSTAELGVLAHLPSDPARYGFDTAALNRSAPPGTARPVPERAGRTGPGWTRHGWTNPPDNAPGGGSPDGGAEPVRTTPYRAADPDDDLWGSS